MAPSLLAAASPFLLPAAASRRPLVAGTGRRAASSLRVAALKYDPSKVAPQSDRVLVRLEQIPEKSAGGVLLPKSAVKFERYLMGEILSVGADVSDVEAGKKVLFSDINAYEVDLGTDEKHCFCQLGERLSWSRRGRRLVQGVDKMPRLRNCLELRNYLDSDFVRLKIPRLRLSGCTILLWLCCLCLQRAIVALAGSRLLKMLID